LDTKLKGFWEKVKGFFQKLSKKTKIAIAAGAAVLLVLLIALAVWAFRPPEYAVLFTDLESAEASKVIAYLNDAGVSNRLEGGTIYVPADQEPLLKARLVMEGYPQSGYGYENYWDKSSIVSTNAQERRAFILSLQDRLQAVICCFDGVRSASVQIAEGEDRRYVLDDTNATEASAFVVVEMDPGRQLSKKQAEAIRRLVSRSVQGLDLENVELSDTNGGVYSDVDSMGDLSEGSQLKLQFEEEMANRIRQQILNVLSGPFGENNVKVGVMVTADVSLKAKETTSFTHPEQIGEDGKGVIDSEYWLNEILQDGEVAVGGVPGTSTNADLNHFSDYVEGVLQPDGDETAVISQGETQYENPTTTEQEKSYAGTITDVSVAVSINHENDGSINAEEVQAHVARAAGILPEQEDKVHIWITPFYNYVEDTEIPDNPFATVPNWALYAAVAGLILFIILLILILSISKRRQKQREKEMLAALSETEAAALAQAALAAAGNPLEPPQTGADIMDINAEKSMELRKTVRQFVNNNPEIAAQMLKTWLRGGKEEGNA